MMKVRRAVGMRGRDRAALIGSVCSCPLPVAVSAQAEGRTNRVTDPAPVLRAMDAFVGHWRSDRKTGPDGATFHFEYDLGWLDPGHTIAKVLITRVMSDGVTEVVFEGVKGREPDGRGVYYWAASPTGRGARGTVHLEGERFVTVYDGWTADGSVVRIQDVFTPVRSNAFVSRTYLRTSADAEWRRVAEDHWERGS